MSSSATAKFKAWVLDNTTKKSNQEKENVDKTKKSDISMYIVDALSNVLFKYM